MSTKFHWKFLNPWPLTPPTSQYSANGNKLKPKKDQSVAEALGVTFNVVLCLFSGVVCIHHPASGIEPAKLPTHSTPPPTPQYLKCPPTPHCPALSPASLYRLEEDGCDWKEVEHQ